MDIPITHVGCSVQFSNLDADDDANGFVSSRVESNETTCTV